MKVSGWCGSSRNQNTRHICFRNRAAPREPCRNRAEVRLLDIALRASSTEHYMPGPRPGHVLLLGISLNPVPSTHKSNRRPSERLQRSMSRPVKAVVWGCEMLEYGHGWAVVRMVMIIVLKMMLPMLSVFWMTLVRFVWSFCDVAATATFEW